MIAGALLAAITLRLPCLPAYAEPPEATQDLAEALVAALQDEYKARATYRKVIAAHGEVRPFVNIVEAEERHVQALVRAFERHGLSVPRDTWPTRVTTPATLRQACAAAVATERENASLYDRLIEAVADHPDVRETFNRLRSASRDRHLPAFERCVEREKAGRPGRAVTPSS